MNGKLDPASQAAATVWEKDIMIRYRKNEERVEVSARESDKFLEALSRNYVELRDVLQRDIDILSTAVKEQKRLIEYKDLYVSYVSGLLDEEEMERESRRFLREPFDKVNINELAYGVRRLIQLTGLGFSSLELSEIFRVSVDTLHSVRPLVESTGAVQLGKD